MTGNFKILAVRHYTPALNCGSLQPGIHRCTAGQLVKFSILSYVKLSIHSCRNLLINCKVWDMLHFITKNDKEQKWIPSCMILWNSISLECFVAARTVHQQMIFRWLIWLQINKIKSNKHFSPITHQCLILRIVKKLKFMHVAKSTGHKWNI